MFISLTLFIMNIYVNMQFPNHLLPLVGQVKDATTLEPQIDSNLS